MFAEAGNFLLLFGEREVLRIAQLNNGRERFKLSSNIPLVGPAGHQVIIDDENFLGVN